MSEIEEHLAAVRAVIGAACARAMRDPDSVRLVAVSKRKPAAAVLAAFDAGVRHFGENRVEELQEKRAAVMTGLQARDAVDALHWHMIGHIQSRKARHVPHLADMVESVDSVAIAERLSRQVVEHGQAPLPVLVQVNVSGEETKGGLEASGWQNAAAVRDGVLDQMRTILALPGLAVRGLMTMAPYVDDAELVRPVFVELRTLRDAMQAALAVDLPELSMGMTNDYAVAIEEGATIVRIGRAIFGERD
ncbi:MAG: YggS family pyridoxal phosphate-dependent enzyme [Chloroflexota bacterium]